MFKDVTLQWGETAYSIPADKVLMAIAEIEEHISIVDLSSGKPKMAKLAMAYHAVLHFAGAKSITQHDVYVALFDADEQVGINNAVAGILAVMQPPETVRQPKKKATTTRAKKS